MVVQRVRAGNQLAQAPEELFQPQVGSEALVEGVFVKNHAAGFLGAHGGRARIARPISPAS